MSYNLGIDVRNSRVRLARFKKGFRDIRLEGFAQSGKVKNNDPESMARTAMSLIQEHELGSEHIILGLSEKDAYVRKLDFPFSRKDKIAQVLPYELESYLPLSMKDNILDFQLTCKVAEKRQGVLTATLNKNAVKKWVDAFRNYGLEPEIIDLDLSILRLLAEELAGEFSGNTLLWDIGEEQSSVIYTVEGNFAGSRFLNFGLEENESVSDIRNVLHRELGILFWSLQSEMPGIEWSRLVLMGEGANIKGIDAFITRETGITAMMAGDIRFSWLNGTQMKPEQTHCLLVAAGLGLRGERFNKGFNFRKDEQANRGIIAWKGPLKHGVIGLSIIFLAWAGAVGVDIYLKKQRLQTLEAEVEKVFRSIVPEPKSSLKQFQYASVVQSRIESLQRTYGRGGANSNSSVLELLSTLSTAVSQDMDVMVENITITEDRTHFSGTAKSYDAVNVLKNRLDKAEGIQSVNIEGVKTGSKKDNNVQFTLSLIRGG